MWLLQLCRLGRVGPLLLWRSQIALLGTACLKVCRRSARALQLLEAEKARVRREFERREAAIEVKKKVGAGPACCCWPACIDEP